MTSAAAGETRSAMTRKRRRDKMADLPIITHRVEMF
jgi:hypothetical protein